MDKGIENPVEIIVLIFVVLAIVLLAVTYF
jgi:hypothetical protein